MSSAIVTGGAGFIGSHLVDSLLEDGYEVTVVDDLSTGDRELVAGDAALWAVDIADRPALEKVFDLTRPSAVFHLAAQSSVAASLTDPLRDCGVNLQGTLNVLEAAHRHRAPVVYASAGAALYGASTLLPTPESHPPRPLTPHGASKLAAESYVQTWALTHDVAHSIWRLASVYGPRQGSDGEGGWCLY